MKKIILFILLAQTALAQSLSDKARISIITMGPSNEELYAAFGHSAIRVEDPLLGIDEAYNYGVFDFDQPNFYLNFAKGYLYYRLGVYDYKRFEYVYIYRNRSVHEQELNLTLSQKQRLYDFLLWNAQPENANYRYDYFYDNCATKIRDVMKTVFGDSIRFDDAAIKTNYSFRQLTDLYLNEHPWGDLGIDICLGLPMDKKASPQEYMFLPDYVESSFARASLNSSTGQIPLVQKVKVIYEATPEGSRPNLTRPVIVFSVLLVACALLTYRDFKRRKATQLFDIVFFSILGAIGLLLLLLWIATDHQAAARNMNIWWALPTHLVAVIAFIRQPAWLSKYFLAVACASVLLLVSWAWLPQMLHMALIPIVVIVAMRSALQYYVRQQKAN